MTQDAHPTSAGNVTPTPRKSSTLRVPMLVPQQLLQRQQQQPSHRPQIQRTPLSSAENTNAIESWDTLIHESYLTQFSDLEQVLHSLQIPLQPISLRACQEEFKHSKGRFSFRDFISLLERLKTLHGKWMHKLRGKLLDDDLLEAFVAVGGQSDSNGEVDLTKMRAVVGEFQLNVDLDKIIAEMDNDGSANIDFGEFASLIRDSAAGGGGAHASAQGKSPPRRNRAGGDEDDDDLFNLDSMEDPIGGDAPQSASAPAPITLSSMMYVDEDLDQALLFPPLGLTSRKDPGELSTRKRSEANLLTHRRRSQLHLVPSGENTPHAGHPAGGTTAGGPGGAKRGGPKLAPVRNASRTQLAPSNGNNSHASSGATAFYKGGGGLRNLTPAPGGTSAKKGNTHGQDANEERPPRSQSSMAAVSSVSPSPLRGTIRAPKKHKFAN